MTAPPLTGYRLLARAPWPRSYPGKLFLVAFLGTHVPVLALLGYLAIREGAVAERSPLLIVVVGATLVAAGLTLWALRHLVAPVLATADALDRYADDGTLPDLPETFEDEAGRLMRHTQRTIGQFDESLRFQNRLLRAIAHDARTPLTSIVMATDIIQSHLGEASGHDAELHEMTDIIRRSAQYQTDLFEDLVRTTRGDPAHFQIRTDKVTLHTLIDLVLDDMRLLAQERDVHLAVDLETAGHMILQTDVTKLRQILDNLISNAIKFSHRGGHVDLGATVSADTLLLYVQDQGPGIDAAVRDHLFEPFSTASPPDADAAEGFGVGLWVSKTFARLLGGDIDVESRPGHGSTFIVHFPLEVIQESP
jgi:signal transduction histidine kinase